jgi:hypothetical protein
MNERSIRIPVLQSHTETNINHAELILSSFYITGNTVAGA